MSKSRKSSVNRNTNGVFYAETYHPIQAGSIDGTDIHPHDNAIYRALLCSSAGLYDPTGDVKVKGDPFCTLFVARLSRSTTEHSLLKALSKYGRVKNLRLVRDIVTGGSRGYAFVEYETEREMRRAYEDAHHSYVDDSEIIVDYNRQQLMPGWIPRRLGGGLGGKKESGQLRFGGRERPFHAPLRPVPYDDLKRLGIAPPPEGRYMSRFQVPSPPCRKRNSEERERLPSSSKKNYEGKETSPNGRKRNSEERERLPSSSKSNYKEKETSPNGRKRYSEERERLPSSSKRNYEGKEASLNRRKRNSEDWGTSSSRSEGNPQDVRKSSSSSRREQTSEDRETSSPRRKRSSGDSENRKDKHSPRHHKHRRHSPHHYEKP